MLTLSGIFKSFVSGRKRMPALYDISLKIGEGEFVALTGPSGSGKSTLLHIMGGLDNPTHGEVIFQNKNLHKMNDKQLSEVRNNSIGFVFQDDLLLPHLTLFENVALPLMFAGRRVDDVEIKRILHEVGLEKHLNHKPAELSSGQRQRACVARSIVMHPVLILADEPTGNLDAKTGREIINLFKELHVRHKITFVIATHDAQIAEAAQRTIHIIDGKI